jgi:hypothetical protein
VSPCSRDHACRAQLLPARQAAQLPRHRRRQETQLQVVLERLVELLDQPQALADPRLVVPEERAGAGLGETVLAAHRAHDPALLEDGHTVVRGVGPQHGLLDDNYTSP